jgi:hypothetical protein
MDENLHNLVTLPNNDQTKLNALYSTKRCLLWRRGIADIASVPKRRHHGFESLRGRKDVGFFSTECDVV